MNITIDSGESEKKIIAYGPEKEVLGWGYISPFLSSDLYNNRRYNIFINVGVESDKNKQEIKDFIFENLMKRARNIRNKYKNMEARVYHCCFSEDTENINYYKSKEGFNHDEGMHIIKCDINDKNYDYILPDGVTLIENILNSDQGINSFIKSHSKVFENGAYTVEEINEFKNKEGWKSISIKDEDAIIANILLCFDRYESKRIGLIEDLFVHKKWRGKGIGKYLISEGLEYFKSKGINESRLEVWSANKRALELYNKFGFEFYKETQSSIGRSI